ncbi:MAG: hypothetical protein ACREEM_07065 [Blastocatellia bacterium]
MKKDLIKKFMEIEKEIAKEKGKFTLFGLFHREGTLYDQWDLVASAPWIGEDRFEHIPYFVGKMKERLTTEERIMVPRIVLLNPSEPFVEDIAETVNKKRGVADVFNHYFNGMMIERGHVITAKAA